MTHSLLPDDPNLSPQAANSRKIKKLPERLKEHCWKKGQSGNLSGRPKGLLANEAVKQLLKNKGVRLESVIEGLLKSCEEGNPKAFAVLRDSVDGRPVQQIDLNAKVTMTLAERVEKARKAVGKK